VLKYEFHLKIGLGDIQVSNRVGPYGPPVEIGINLPLLFKVDMF
jgi:hypothetical protein